MSDNVDERAECDAMRDDLATIALGIESGRRRAEVLAHVERCSSCSDELERLSIVADAVLDLAPEIEPPLGFEMRLARRLQTGAPSRAPVRRRRAGAFALAAAVLVVLGLGVGVLVSSPTSTNPGPASSRLAEANLSSSGHVVGKVILSAGEPSWMLMTIDSGSWSGPVTCEVVLAGGKVETIGRFNLAGGYGAWGAPLSSPAREVRGARLVAPDGTVLASASLRT